MALIVYVLFLFVFAAIAVSVTLYGLQRSRGQGWSDLLETAPANEAHGIIFGRSHGKHLVFSPSSKEAHVAVFASSGAGKTTSILQPSLCAFLKANNTDTPTAGTYAIDISGDILRETVNFAPSPLVFDPYYDEKVEEARADKESPWAGKLTYFPAPYNVFAEIDKLPNPSMELRRLAELMLPIPVNADSASTYYTSGAQRILKAVFLTFYPRGLDFVEIMQKIVNIPLPELLDAIDQSGQPEAIAQINGMEDGHKENRAGCYDHLTAAVEFFTTDVCRAWLRRPYPGEDVITPASVEGNNVYICIPDALTGVWSPVLSIITAQTLNYFAGRRENLRSKKILFLLDEFASLNLSVEQISAAAQKYRKCGVRIMILLQSLNSLYVLYGTAQTKALLDNFTIQVCMGTNDPDCQEYFARKIGKAVKASDFLDSMTLNKARLAAMPKDWIVDPMEFGALQQLKENIVIFPGGYRRLKLFFWYEREKYYQSTDL